MQHPDEGLIHAWLDGGLPASEAATIEAHVATCDECKPAVAEARGLIAASSRIVSSLDATPRGVLPAFGAKPRRRWNITPWASAIAATLVIGVGLAGLESGMFSRSALTSDTLIATRPEAQAPSAATGAASPATSPSASAPAMSAPANSVAVSPAPVKTAERTRVAAQKAATNVEAPRTAGGSSGFSQRDALTRNSPIATPPIAASAGAEPLRSSVTQPVVPERVSATGATPPSAPVAAAEITAQRRALDSASTRGAADARLPAPAPKVTSSLAGTTAGAVAGNAGSGAGARMAARAPAARTAATDTASRVVLSEVVVTSGSVTWSNARIQEFVGCYELSASEGILPRRFALLSDSSRSAKGAIITLPAKLEIRYVDSAGKITSPIDDIWWTLTGEGAAIQNDRYGTFVGLELKNGVMTATTRGVGRAVAFFKCS